LQAQAGCGTLLLHQPCAWCQALGCCWAMLLVLLLLFLLLLEPAC
jgi:hypothetical protein